MDQPNAKLITPPVKQASTSAGRPDPKIPQAGNGGKNVIPRKLEDELKREPQN